ncbi:CPBP family glutamic-type intramembrane protease [Sunxiuqinia sp. A32]|uniref:CPBP family glutamic-type intramembrane protease n=1 Tax=Sunxiuqinia sp. A32 TaxID=3461496 RepID=UPI004045C05B
MKKGQFKKLYLYAEFVLFFFFIPLYLLIGVDILHPSSVLIPFVLLAFFILYFFTKFKWKELWAFDIKWKQVWLHLAIAFGVSLLMIAYMLLFDRKNLFNLPLGNLKVWLTLSTFYPIFSAYVQEVLFRTYIFKRYQNLFGNGNLMILMSALAFSFAHILYYHPVSLILTLILGIYVGRVYQKTQSVLFVAFLHGLYGNMVFTVGLGHYFWLDMFKWI